jgi:hypothetical protein
MEHVVSTLHATSGVNTQIARVVLVLDRGSREGGGVGRANTGRAAPPNLRSAREEW